MKQVEYGLFLGMCLLFDWLFFRQQVGLNLVAFAAACQGLLFWRRPEAFAKRPVRWLTLAVGIAALLVALYGNMLSKSTILLLLVAQSGLVLEPSVRFLGSALARVMFTLTSWFRYLVKLFKFGLATVFGQTRARQLGFALKRNFTLSVFPVLVCTVFLSLYSAASSDFFDFWIAKIGELDRLLSQLLRNFSLLHILFLGWASWVIYALCFGETAIAANWEAGSGDNLRRIRKTQPFPFHPLALLRSYKSAVLTLWMVNAVLLLFICFDAQFLWSKLGRVTGHREIREMVHQGTYVLLASISLAMFVLLWIFRGNINFLTDNRLLRRLAYCWLLLNGLLLISVLVRNSYHIWYNGLGYLRIGVCAFLILTAAGLVGLYWKIRHRKTLFFLLRTNAWVWLVVLLSFTAVDWNRVIVSYNLFHHSGKLRYKPFTLTFPDETLDIMLDACAGINPEKTAGRVALATPGSRLEARLVHRAWSFRLSNEGNFSADWRGWSLAEYRTRQKLKKLDLK